jgi:hypothetical protein
MLMVSCTGMMQKPVSGLLNSLKLKVLVFVILVPDVVLQGTKKKTYLCRVGSFGGGGGY